MMLSRGVRILFLISCFGCWYLSAWAANAMKEYDNIQLIRNVLRSDARFNNVRCLDIINPNDKLLGTNKYRWCLMGSVDSKKIQDDLEALIKKYGLKDDVEITVMVQADGAIVSKELGKKDLIQLFMPSSESAKFCQSLSYGTPWFMDVHRGALWKSVGGELDGKLDKDLIVVADVVAKNDKISITLFAFGDGANVSAQKELNPGIVFYCLSPRVLVFNLAKNITSHIAFLLTNNSSHGFLFSGSMFCDEVGVRMGLTMSSQSQSSEVTQKAL